MSMESARLFIETMKTNQNFAKQVIDRRDNEARLAFAKEQGFDFTAFEISSIKMELADEELDMIAGGKCEDHGCGGSIG